LIADHLIIGRSLLVLQGGAGALPRRSRLTATLPRALIRKRGGDGTVFLPKKKNLVGEISMTKAELVAAMADKTGLNKVQAKDALDAFISSVSTSLKAGKEVRVVGFGSFVPIKRPAGTARNPRTGETVKRKASQTCRFRVGDALKSALNP
jgi:DNA-binding protein HU-beta